MGTPGCRRFDNSFFSARARGFAARFCFLGGGWVGRPRSTRSAFPRAVARACHCSLVCCSSPLVCSARPLCPPAAARASSARFLRFVCPSARVARAVLLRRRLRAPARAALQASPYSSISSSSSPFGISLDHLREISR